MKIEILGYEDLTEDEKVDVSNNGAGKEYANYIKVTHDEETILFESDAMEPEDCSFTRDLSWIKNALQICYDLGQKSKI